jgi:pyruvate formate lyase activating enzyme
MTVEEIMEIVLRDRGYYEKTGGGVTFSGGECTQHYDFLAELIQRAKAENVNAAVDTSGYCKPAQMAALAQKADLLLYDVKCIDDALHQSLTDVSNHLILSNLRSLSKDESIRKKIRIRMPLIGGVNDAPELLEAALAFLCECGLRTVDLLPYHLLGVSKYKSLLRDHSVFEPPSRERLEEIASSFEERGVYVSIPGN